MLNNNEEMRLHAFIKGLKTGFDKKGLVYFAPVVGHAVMRVGDYIRNEPIIQKDFDIEDGISRVDKIEEIVGLLPPHDGEYAIRVHVPDFKDFGVDEFIAGKTTGTMETLRVAIPEMTGNLWVDMYFEKIANVLRSVDD